MSLTFNYASLIKVDGNATIDITAATDLPQTHCDLAVVGIGNFASGSYIQKSTDVEDIVSNFTLNADEIKGAGFYLLQSGLPSGLTLSSYGNDVHGTSDKLEIKGRPMLGEHNTGDDRQWFANLQTLKSNRANVSEINKLKSGLAHAGAGPVLVQAASAALFKSFGKHAAINNDKTINGKQTKLSTDMSAAWEEDSANYTDSKIFKRYLDSGRYADDNVADVNTAVPYNVTSTTFDFIVQLEGNVSDNSGDDLDLVRILGNSTAGETKVKSNGSYKFNVFMRLEHQTDVVEAVAPEVIE